MSFYGKSKASPSDNQYLYLLGEKHIAVVYTNKTDNTDEEYDVFKLIYNYDLVKDNIHVLNITGLNYEKSSFLLSSYTADKYECKSFDSLVPHNFSEKVCKREAINFTYTYPTPFIAIIKNENDHYYTVKSKYFDFSLDRTCIIILYILIARLSINKLIESPLQTTPITSHTFAIISDNSINSITPGFKYDKDNKCGKNIVNNITKFDDKDYYTIIKMSSEEEREYYCLNVTYDINSAYCSSKKPGNDRFISLYNDDYKKYPKMCIILYIYLLFI